MPYSSGPADAGALDGEPPRRRRWPLIAVSATLVTLVVIGVSAVLLLRDRADQVPVADPSEQPAVVEPTALPTGSPATGGAAPESSADPRFVKVGQCVRNEGPTGGRPELLITECGTRTYEVLRRFDEATSGERDAEAKCAKVEGYTNWYFFDSELDTLDFVLCLKLR
ncbi:LppU/SCO3897 family protein [Micromonospora yangpuensis]|uniref:LppU/SCO3897 family protein n=1 Tax=Micromonospora yangpuensis TaxID=683228 RepID=UPI000B8870BB|nr:hypothetical protein [Micromonospora yangpuensis]